MNEASIFYKKENMEKNLNETRPTICLIMIVLVWKLVIDKKLSFLEKTLPLLLLSKIEFQILIYKWTLSVVL